jgi:RimJ/RimL family protein N-acetyltransferase
VTHPYWPLFDLRLHLGNLELAPMTEADQPAVADLLPDDVELDPRIVRHPLGDEHRIRGVVVHQGYWRAFGTWSPDSWVLPFAVRRRGELVGSQVLEGEDFLALRTVDTASFLVPTARGTGIGKRMRIAVLALAFGPLGARAATTSAWHDNHPSLGVSRSLGYHPNGEAFHRREGVDGGVDVMVHMRLTREDWLAREPDDVRIENFRPCRPLFGLPTNPQSPRRG